MAETIFQLILRCADCGAQLKVLNFCVSDLAGKQLLAVVPCLDCLAEARKERSHDVKTESKSNGQSIL